MGLLKITFAVLLAATLAGRAHAQPRRPAGPPPRTQVPLSVPDAAPVTPARACEQDRPRRATPPPPPTTPTSLRRLPASAKRPQADAALAARLRRLGSAKAPAVRATRARATAYARALAVLDGGAR